MWGHYFRSAMSRCRLLSSGSQQDPFWDPRAKPRWRPLHLDADVFISSLFHWGNMSMDDAEEQVDRTGGTWELVRTAVAPACTWNWSLQLHVFVITGEWGFYLRISYTKQEEVLTFNKHPFTFCTMKRVIHTNVCKHKGCFRRNTFAAALNCCSFCS